MHIRPVGTGDSGWERGVIRRESGFGGQGSDFQVLEPGIGALNLDSRAGIGVVAVDRSAVSAAVDGGAFSGIALDDDGISGGAGELREEHVTFVAGPDSL